MSGSEVLSIQHAMQALVRDGAANADGLLQGPSALGLSIYREAYVARLVAALRDNHLVLHRAMGDEAFDELARAYLEAHPSEHPSIRWFGHRLADFMANAYSERLEHPALVDFARMDWALRTAFDGPNASVLRAEDLHSVAPDGWPGLVFRLHPTVVLQTLDWAIEPAWRALRAHDPDSGEEATELAAPEQARHELLVWRQGFETRWRAIEPLEVALLQALGQAQSFEKICALGAGHVGEEAAAGTVVQQLQRWLGDGLLSGFA